MHRKENKMDSIDNYYDKIKNNYISLSFSYDRFNKSRNEETRNQILKDIAELMHNISYFKRNIKNIYFGKNVSQKTKSEKH